MKSVGACPSCAPPRRRPATARPGTAAGHPARPPPAAPAHHQPPGVGGVGEHRRFLGLQPGQRLDVIRAVVLDDPAPLGQATPDALAQLGRGLAGEGQAQDLLGLDQIVGHQPDHPGGHGLGLARPGPGDDGRGSSPDSMTACCSSVGRSRPSAARVRRHRFAAPGRSGSRHLPSADLFQRAAGAHVAHLAALVLDGAELVPAHPLDDVVDLGPGPAVVGPSAGCRCSGSPAGRAWPAGRARLRPARCRGRGRRRGGSRAGRRRAGAVPPGRRTTACPCRS